MAAVIDATPVGQLAESLAERIREQCGDNEFAFVRMAAIIVEIDAGTETRLFRAFSDDRPWVQIAFLDEMIEQITADRHRLASE